MSLSSAPRPVIFGEALRDVFEDGSAVVGGAPFNVAWNLKGFGLNPLFISAIGDDEHGEHMLDAMRGWGLDTGSVQIDPEHPTGMVKVTVQEGQPSFSILPDQAYDFIDEGKAQKALADGKFSIFYHGSLIARSEVSRKALYSLKRSLNVPVFVDVNLRSPWWDLKSVEKIIDGAQWVKLNDNELCDLMENRFTSRKSLAEGAKTMRNNHKIKTLVVTMGGDGAMIVSGDGVVESPVAPVDEIRDTVGAGDAFSAVSILGLISGWPLMETVKRATAFASEICRIRGATSSDRSLYKNFSLAWGL